MLSTCEMLVFWHFEPIYAHAIEIVSIEHTISTPLRYVGGLTGNESNIEKKGRVTDDPAEHWSVPPNQRAAGRAA